MTPWYKISFAPWLSGTALCTRWPRKGHDRIKGQWFVFDKNVGHYPVLFHADDANDCHAWVEHRRAGITACLALAASIVASPAMAQPVTVVPLGNGFFEYDIPGQPPVIATPLGGGFYSYQQQGQAPQQYGIR